jgi:hypothetical protein
LIIKALTLARVQWEIETNLVYNVLNFMKNVSVGLRKKEVIEQ